MSVCVCVLVPSSYSGIKPLLARDPWSFSSFASPSGLWSGRVPSPASRGRPARGVTHGPWRVRVAAAALPALPPTEPALRAWKRGLPRKFLSERVEGWGAERREGGRSDDPGPHVCEHVRFPAEISWKSARTLEVTVSENLLTQSKETERPSCFVFAGDGRSSGTPWVRSGSARSRPEFGPPVCVKMCVVLRYLWGVPFNSP